MNTCTVNNDSMMLNKMKTRAVFRTSSQLIGTTKTSHSEVNVLCFQLRSLYCA